MTETQRSNILALLTSWKNNLDIQYWEYLPGHPGRTGNLPPPVVPAIEVLKQIEEVLYPIEPHQAVNKGE